MGKLIESKLYKKSFKNYSILLLVVLTIVFFLTGKSILNAGLLHYEYRIKKCFESCERLMDGATSEIDTRVLEMYSDEELLTDFISFWNNSMSDYISASLDRYYQSGRYVSFTDSLISFLSGKEYCISEVLFVGDGKIKKMTSDGKGNCNLEYGISYDTYIQEMGERRCSYVKEIKDPENMKKNLGCIVFVFDTDKMMQICGEEYTAYSFDKISKIQNYDSYTSFGIFNSSYVFENTSERYGFCMSVEILRKEVISDSMLSLSIVFIVMVFAYVVLILLIGQHMRKESEALSTIIDSIKSGHNGSFKRIDTGKRKDEYSAIANELNSMATELEKYIQREYVLTIEQQQANMRALLYQINPHFLYNTLEVIRAGAIKNNDETTADALVSLAKMYRMLVKEPGIIAVSREIELLCSYLNLMEYKFKDNFTYQIDVESSVMELKTVKFWMQPLAENFFVHGADANSEFNLLIVNGREYEDRFVIQMIDNGKNISDERLNQINELIRNDSDVTSGEGIGIVNVAKRLRTFYGKLQIELKRSEIKGTTVEVTIYK